MKKGHLIILEGVDGSGKNTQAKLIQGEFGGVITRLPFYENYTGQAIVAANVKMKEGISEEAYQSLMAANYIEHLDSFIMEKINNGENVIMTRFLPSMSAYGKYFGIDEGFLEKAIDMVSSYYRWSIGETNIHQIYLGIPIEVSMARIKKRDEETDQKIQPLFEREEILTSVIGEYKLSHMMFDHVADATDTVEGTFNQVKGYLENKIT